MLAVPKSGKESRDRNRSGQGVRIRDGQLVSLVRAVLFFSRAAGEQPHRLASVIISSAGVFALVLICGSARSLPAGFMFLTSRTYNFVFGGFVELLFWRPLAPNTPGRPQSICLDRFCMILCGDCFSARCLAEKRSQISTTSRACDASQDRSTDRLFGYQECTA